MSRRFSRFSRCSRFSRFSRFSLVGLFLWAGAAVAKPKLAVTPKPVGASTSTATSKPAVTPRAKKPSRPEQASKPKEVGARELLRQALGLYVRGRYEEAAARLGPLVQQKRLADRADQIEALRTYGIALFLSGARPGSERAFRELLRLAPKERLDPDFVKSEVVRFFESVRRRFRRELDKVVRQSAPKRSAVVNLLPPWGQAQNGHEGKVWVLAIGFGVTAAVSIGTAAAWYGARNDDGTFNTSDARANGLKVTNLVAAGLFAGFYLYGVIDGLVYYFKNRRARLDGEHVSRQVKGLALAPNGFRVRF